jgi:hypothetical protein
MFGEAIAKPPVEDREGTTMKTFVKSMLLAGAVTLGANGVIAAQLGNDWQEQWFQKKYGRSTPAEERRLQAEQASTAYRADTTGGAPAPANTWMEQWYAKKYGRNTPAEEARLDAERANTAFREETRPAADNNWFDRWFEKKYGRSPEVNRR